MALKKGFKIFEIEKKPRKGLLAVEWIIIGYMVLTMLLAFFMTTKIHHIEPMIWGRFRMVMMMLGLWLVYRLIPIRSLQDTNSSSSVANLPYSSRKPSRTLFSAN